MSPRAAAFPLYPSVSEVLESCGLGGYFPNTPEMARARLRGTALHQTIELHAAGELDVNSVHPEIFPGFTAYLSFIADHGHIAEASELELVHEDYGVVGHLDRVGTVDEYKTCIIDAKYSDAPDLKAATLQVTGGYRAIWDYVHPERPAERCYVLALRKDGTYRLHDVSDSGHASQIFMAALIVWRARNASRG